LALLAGMAVLGSDQTVLKQALDAISRHSTSPERKEHP
jgi:hypothetical protein